MSPFIAFLFAVLLADRATHAATNQAMFHAIGKGDVGTVQRLIQADESLAKCQQNSATALRYAATTGKYDIVELLLHHHAGNDAEQLQYTLKSAAWNGHTQIGKLLITHGATLDIGTAAGLGMKDKVAEFIRKNPALLKRQGFMFDTPLEFAAAAGQREIVKYLIAQGAKLNHETIDYGYPLHVAIGNNQSGMVEFLISLGADVNAGGPAGEPPLMAAIRWGNMDMVRLLIAKCANVNCRFHSCIQAFRPSGFWSATKDYGTTPLHEAVKAKNEPLVSLLLAHNADVNQTSEHRTPLDVAVEANLDSIAELLRLYGVKQSKKD